MTIWYIDAQQGNDANTGRSPEQAWQTLTMANSITLRSGDALLLKSGCVWQSQQLILSGFGDAESSVLLSRYGDADAPLPLLQGNGEVESCLSIVNPSYWEISHLEISNQPAGFTGERNDANGSLLTDRRGIHISADNVGACTSLWLHHLSVHDVSGEVCMIGGSGGDEPGIKHDQGWDKSKRTGGIVFEVMEPQSRETHPSWFEQVTIEDSQFSNNSFASVIFKQWLGDTGWASRDGGEDDPNWTPHRNITIRRNHLDHSGSDYACNTLYLTSSKESVITENLSYGAGICAIELYYADTITVARNEIYKVVAKATGADSNAIDPDKEATQITIQYNYIQDTGDGILLCGLNYGSAVVRYNILQNASRNFINPHSDKGNYDIYNNVLINTNDLSSVSFINSSGGNSKYLNDSNCFYHFYNNIFYNVSPHADAETITASGSGTEYSHNCWFTPQAPDTGGDDAPVIGDPLFSGPLPINQPVPATSFIPITLQAGSPCIDAGLVYGDAVYDFFGTPLSPAHRDIGVAEYDAG